MCTSITIWTCMCISSERVKYEQKQRLKFQTLSTVHYIYQHCIFLFPYWLRSSKNNKSCLVPRIYIPLPNEKNKYFQSFLGAVTLTFSKFFLSKCPCRRSRLVSVVTIWSFFFLHNCTQKLSNKFDTSNWSFLLFCYLSHQQNK